MRRLLQSKLGLLLLFVLLFNASFAQKSEYKKIIDSLKIISKDIQYRNPDSAVILFSALSNYYKLDNNINDYNIIKVNLASCYLLQHKNNEALKILVESSKYFESINDSVHMYTVYVGLTGVYSSLGDRNKIAYYLKQANQICNAKKYPNLKFISHVNLGNYFQETLQNDSAILYYNLANKLLPQLKEPIYAYHLKVQFAYLYYTMHQFDKSIKTATDALQLNNNFDIRLTMRTYYTLGLCYLEKKVFDKSQIYLDSAILISKKVNSNRDTYEFLLDVVKLDTAIGNYKKATTDLILISNLKDSIYEVNKNNLTKELLVKYETEKQEAENKLLEIENKKRSEIIKWQRFLIGLVAILSLAIMLILFFYLRFRNKQQKDADEREKNAAEIKALKAQLSPHFIQNIFQTIANQVNANPTDVASFLQTTANYFRSILNSTEKNIQTLEDEIIFTEKYLQFQKNIFGDKLTYDFNITDNVDSFDILVPAMILQPFIENSIKYGLQHSQKPMNINIICTKDDNFLYIEIIDNGCAVVKDTTAKEKSFGISLISKRLDLFYRNAVHKPTLQALPIKDNIGYKVELSLPLQK